MGTPFIAELRLVSFNFAPKGWALCNGQTLPINQNQALFSLLGLTYGGNGTTNFVLPNLQGRTPMHFGLDVVQGQAAGVETVTLTTQQMPLHTHVLNGDSDLANASVPSMALPAAKPRGGITRYAPPGSPVLMDASSVGSSGGTQAHNNIQPSLVVNCVIALQGIFPSRN